jgi:bacteriocin biosynthesis cyclodehydratase domain-containing protein
MGERVRTRKSLRVTSPLDILVVGSSSFEALRAKLARAFGTTAVTIHSTADLKTHRLCAPTLTVFVHPNEIIIGPLALPGRAGCGHCASERMRAAAIANPPAIKNESTSTLTNPALTHEVRSIVRHGADRSRLLDHVLVIDDDGGQSLHRIIPLPLCPVCGGATVSKRVDGNAQHLSGDDSPAEVLDALAGWVDPRTGVISRIVIEDQFPIVITAAPPHVFEDDGSPCELPIGWGKGLTLSGAILSAVGEAVERYSASLPDLTRLVWARPHELEGEVLDPSLFALYSEDQYRREGFPYVRFDPGVHHPWVLGHWLGTTRPVWVPAVFTFLSLTVWKEHAICGGTSNGLAASTNVDDAALRATLELVERDAFLAAWLTGRPGRRIKLENEPELARVIADLEALGATVEIYALETSAWGTTVLCLAFGDGDRYPGVTLGLGAALDPRSAVRQAVLELGQTGPYLRRIMQSKTLRAPANASDVREMLDHAAYYFPAERASAFDRVRSDKPAVSISDLYAPPKPADIRVAIVDVTSPDVATGPFRVVRAVSPDLQGLAYGYGMDRAVVSRIRAMGLAAEVPDIHPIW